MIRTEPPAVSDSAVITASDPIVDPNGFEAAVHVSIVREISTDPGWPALVSICLNDEVHMTRDQARAVASRLLELVESPEARP